MRFKKKNRNGIIEVCWKNVAWIKMAQGDVDW